MNPLFDTPPIPVMTAMSPYDANRVFTWDFSEVLDAGDTIMDVVAMESVPDDLTVGTGIVVDRPAGPKLGVQATLGLGTVGKEYTVTAKILTANGVPLARSLLVPVAIR